MTRRAQPHHKKVDYIELVYDLIFVYLIKRCIDLLVIGENGFFSWEDFNLYLLSILIIMQVWAYSTLFVNRYGRNGLFEYLFLILNMFLLCFMGSYTRDHWEQFYIPYQTAWGLIIINLIAQYVRVLRRPQTGVLEQRFLLRRIIFFLVQAAVIFLSIPFYEGTHTSVGWIALGVGYLAPLAVRHLDSEVPINLGHLAERIMLFVVLSFGETLISAAGYFSGGPTLHTIYFAVCAFFIVIGMLLAYGFIYDRLLDRQRLGVGTYFMFLHVFVVLAINDVTVGLEYMHEAESNDFLTLLFLSVSFLIYYAVLLYIAHRAGRYYLPVRHTWLPFIIISAVYMVAVFCFVSNRWINAAISVVYPYAMFIAIFVRRRDELAEHPEEASETG